MTLSRRAVVLIGLVVLVLLAGYTWIFHDVFASRVPGANDFFSRWAGAHLYLTKGWNPYGEETSLWIQKAVWGHPAEPGEDPSLFAYPFYTVFLIAPYALIPTYDWAQAVWQVTLQVVALATLFLLLRYHHWRPKPWMLGVLVLWMIFFYPTARSLILGQLGLVVFLMTVWAAWLLFRVEPPRPVGDGWAGVLLALTTVKPQMQFLIIPFVVLWALRERRWWVIGGLGAALSVLMGASFILLPSWVGEWLSQVSLYPSYTPPAVLYILTREVLPLGPAAAIIERILDVLLLGYLLYEWWLVLWRREDARLDWVLGLILVVTHLVAPRTATTHFVVFTFALIPIFRDLARVRPWGMWATMGLMVVLLSGMWWLFLATLQGNQEHDFVHVPLPLVMFVCVVLTRPRSTSGRSLEASA
ncbi:MAG: DUF2029 domain-containing protein [Anaerolineae bacterium]|nr:DUF2029 domain-containing protein [Anaerolineae bacterium]